MAIASWAVAGVVLLLGESVVRLSRVAVSGVRDGLSPAEWTVLVILAVVVGYCEGYRVFTRSFGPRVVARAFELAAAPRVLHVLLAPLFAMSLVGDTRRRLARNWVLLLAIVGMILIVRRLPPTWRCVVDGAFAPSLGWAIIVIGVRWASRARRQLDAEPASRAPDPPPPVREERRRERC